MYDRNPAYDVPRAGNSVASRPNRLQGGASRYMPMRQRRQRSFDDTESYQYVNVNGTYSDYQAKYENTYERVREEPEYQNTGRVTYGQMDVIGHGIGRIERHLSSSCGNIDHYSLGGHYAVLGHSHLGTVGHIHLNPAQQNAKDSTVRSFFSCLGGENSQSMTNIDSAGAHHNGTSDGRSTGAVPKNPSKLSQNGAFNSATTSSTKSNKSARNEHNSGTLNRISKSSLQWLLVNKWLPLWAGESPDYKVIDFNFMFSRKCEGCDETGASGDYGHQGIIRFNPQMRTEANGEGDYIPPPREYPTMNGHYPRVIRPLQQMPRLAETYEYRADDLYDRPRHAQCNHAPVDAAAYQDPFRNWAFNFDNNTFRPAGAGAKPKEVRRITDGTYPMQQYMSNCGMASNFVLPQQAEIEEVEQQQPRNSPSPPEASSNSSDGEGSSSKEQSPADESQ